MRLSATEKSPSLRDGSAYLVILRPVQRLGRVGLLERSLRRSDRLLLLRLRFLGDLLPLLELLLQLGLLGVLLGLVGLLDALGAPPLVADLLHLLGWISRLLISSHRNLRP